MFKKEKKEEKVTEEKKIDSYSNFCRFLFIYDEQRL